jgi:hypothetical protein
LATAVSLSIAADGDALGPRWTRSSARRDTSQFTGCDVSTAGIRLGAVIVGLAFLRNEHIGFDAGIGNGLIGFGFDFGVIDNGRIWGGLNDFSIDVGIGGRRIWSQTLDTPRSIVMKPDGIAALDGGLTLQARSRFHFAVLGSTVVTAKSSDLIAGRKPG